jgi:hypothetical protein
MAISNDLMLSILAMDSYNRGNDPGINGLSASGGTSIGKSVTVHLIRLAVGAICLRQRTPLYERSCSPGANLPRMAYGFSAP